ncbi:Protein of unknown function [Gryllus bimaculatus]|nr:Protein of unknown function [Gryllus bimaculatus]
MHSIRSPLTTFQQRKLIVGGDQRARARAHDVTPKQQHGLPAGRLQQHQRVVPAAGAVLRLRPQPVPQQRPRAHGGPGRLRRRPGPVHRAPRLLQEVPAEEEREAKRKARLATKTEDKKPNKKK